MFLVLHVELDQRGLCRQPVGDALDQPQPVESGQHQFGALLLGHPGDVERDRRVGDDPGDQDPFTFEQSCHIRPFPQCPMPMPPSTGITAPEM